MCFRQAMLFVTHGSGKQMNNGMKCFVLVRSDYPQFATTTVDVSFDAYTTALIPSAIL